MHPRLVNFGIIKKESPTKLIDGYPHLLNVAAIGFLCDSLIRSMKRIVHHSKEYNNTDTSRISSNWGVSDGILECVASIFKGIVFRALDSV